MKKPSSKMKEPPYQLTEEDKRLISLFIDYRNIQTPKSQDRFISVRDSVEAYAKSQNKILPPKFMAGGWPALDGLRRILVVINPEPLQISFPLPSSPTAPPAPTAPRSLACAVAGAPSPRLMPGLRRARRPAAPASGEWRRRPA